MLICLILKDIFIPLYFGFLLVLSSAAVSCMGGGGIRLWSTPTDGVREWTRFMTFVSFGRIKGNLEDSGMTGALFAWNVQYVISTHLLGF